MITSIVLAAGLSTRMGRSKPLLPYGDATLIEAIVSRLAAAALGEIIVVTGHEAEAVAGKLTGLPADPVFNPDYAAGEMISSIQTGLRAASPASRGGLICLGDQPDIGRDTLDRLMEEVRGKDGDAILLPSFQGRRGHPIVVPRSFWPRILAVPATGSLRDVIHDPSVPVRTVDVKSDSVLHDIDTPDDYRNALERKPQRPS